MATASFLECVGAVAAEHRKRVDAELIDIAYWSRASQGTISRFERNLAQPRELDRLLLAYAKVCGVSAAEIVREAVERWEEGGGATAALANPMQPLDEVAQELEAAGQAPTSPPARSARGGPARRRAGRER